MQTNAVCSALYQIYALGNVQIAVCGNFLQQKCILAAASVLLSWRIMHTNNTKILNAVDCRKGNKNGSCRISKDVRTIRAVVVCVRVVCVYGSGACQVEGRGSG